MSKQKILSIAGVVLLVVLVIVSFSFKGKYDETQLLLKDAQNEMSDQAAASEAKIDELNKQLAEAQDALAGLQTEAEAAKAAIDELTAGKDAAEKLVAELEAESKDTAGKLAAESEALKAASEELATAEAALKEMTAQYNGVKAELEAKITRYNIVRESHAKLAEKYDQLAADGKAAQEELAAALAEKEELEAQLKACKEEIEELTAEEVEYVEPERYESTCGVSFVLPEGASIGNESSKMVEIILEDDARIKINVSTDRVNLLWYDADIEAVNALAATIQID